MAKKSTQKPYNVLKKEKKMCFFYQEEPQTSLSILYKENFCIVVLASFLSVYRASYVLPLLHYQTPSISIAKYCSLSFLFIHLRIVCRISPPLLLHHRGDNFCFVLGPWGLRAFQICIYVPWSQDSNNITKKCPCPHDIPYETLELLVVMIIMTTRQE